MTHNQQMVSTNQAGYNTPEPAEMMNAAYEAAYKLAELVGNNIHYHVMMMYLQAGINSFDQQKQAHNSYHQDSAPLSQPFAKQSNVGGNVQ